MQSQANEHGVCTWPGQAQASSHPYTQLPSDSLQPLVALQLVVLKPAPLQAHCVRLFPAGVVEPPGQGVQLPPDT